MQPPGKGEKKAYLFSPGHMTKMASMLINGLKFRNYSFPEPLNRCLETRYLAYGTLVLQSVYN